MKALFLLLLIFSTGNFLVAQGIKNHPSPVSPLVILPGNYPDPSVAKLNGDYYLTNSTELDNPGLPIWHSRDLIHWKKISYALTEFTGDVWAPDIQYFNKQWFIYFTALTTQGISNFVITAKQPIGPWSKPVNLNLAGIDPGFIASLDGRKYLFTSGGAIAPLDESGTKVVGAPHQVYKGWPIPKHWDYECQCLESPKLLYRNGFYYYFSAQGGTAGPPTSHMVIVARSKNLEGPWENSPYNPVIHTRNASERWWSKGHGTLIEGPEKKWYLIYHAYEKGLLTLGRQVLISEVQWTKDGWIKEGGRINATDVMGTSFTDNFAQSTLGLHWTFMNEQNPSQRYHLTNGALSLTAKGKSPGQSSPLVITPENGTYEIITKVSVGDSSTAGLLTSYNEEYTNGIALTSNGIVTFLKNNISSPIPINGA